MGFYRVPAFYGHPLSLSSVSLALLGFSVIRYWQNYRIALKRTYLLIAILQFILLLFAGGRVSLAIAILLLFTVLMLSQLKYQQKIIIAVSLSVLISSVLWFSGIWHRFLEVYDHGFNSDRFTFWKVYWAVIKSHPWFGIGVGAEASKIRDSYYVLLGYENLLRKYNAHNQYLELVARLGIIGCCYLSILFLALWKNLSQFLTNNKVLMPLLGAFLTNILHSIFQNVFFDANVIALYLGLMWVTVVWQHNNIKKLPN